MASLKADDGFSKLLLKNNNPRMIAQPLLSPLSLTLNATANATLPFDHTSPSYFSIPSFPSSNSSSISSDYSQTQHNSTAMNLVMKFSRTSKMTINLTLDGSQRDCEYDPITKSITNNAGTFQINQTCKSGKWVILCSK